MSTLSQIMNARLTVNATVIPVFNDRIQQGAVADMRNHSALLMPHNIHVHGSVPPGWRVAMPIDIALDTFGFGLNTYTSEVIKLTKAKLLGNAIQTGTVSPAWGRETTAVVNAWLDAFAVNEGGEVLAEVQFFFYAVDGTTPPIEKVANEALPALSSLPERHGIGPLTVNGNAIPGVTSFGYTAGLTIRTQRLDGLTYPQAGAPSGFAPVLQIGHRDPTGIYTELGDVGAKITSTTKIELLKFDNNILSATGQKILTVASGFAANDAQAGAMGDLSSGGVRILVASADGIAHGIAVT